MTEQFYLKEAAVIKISHQPPGYIDIILRQKEITNNAMPGQFIMLESNRQNDPILRRPFDIVNVDKKHNTLRLIIKIVGKGTSLISGLKVGDNVSVVGPLGKGITDFDFSSMIILTRGCGSAAVMLLAEEAHSRGIEIHTILSAQNADKMVLKQELASVSTTFHMATDDGSAGYKGLGTDVLDRLLKEKNVDRVYSCGGGPFYLPYLKKIENKIPVYLFLEGFMACGMGYCHGCAVKRTKTDDYWLVCREGPLFLLNEVDPHV